MKLRKLFYNTVLKIYNKRLSFESLYSEVLEGLEDREKRRLINLVNQFFRNFNYLEQYFIENIDKNIDDQELKISMLILCAGTEYFYLDSSTDYSVVNDFVEIAKEELGQGKAKYINAILRKMTKLTLSDEDKVSKKALYLSHPQWVVDRLIESYGKETSEEMLKFNQSVPPVYVRANRIKNSRQELKVQLEGEGIISSDVEHFEDFLKVEKGNVLSSQSFEEGRFYIQDPSHSLPVLVLEPKKNEKILDLCCAPGGKSTYIQELTGNKVKLHLNDISMKKRVLIKMNFKRLGLEFNKLTFQEAQKFQVFEEFDKVLIDAPCTGSGNFRRHPESRWNKDEEMLSQLNKLQLDILKRASNFVKKNGIMVYSTCSIFNCENMDIVQKFIADDDHFMLDKADNSSLDIFKNADGSYAVNPGIHHHEGSFAVRMRRVR
ncbi:MAG TPA: 16S rRNA (cytosine(967)-C(5))-methyltransferase RsmB [Clostridiales bacterium]|nr:16S rRNA (cytosine(967)-C(5))-methyltransferase RsmB [Clostridiales bacterium]HQP70833.1 16S rRNA (cytosine(967)-C(5))-methyltransferase RsmB [Clostridiales bacterium]